jgi:SAM-dependent methyltransferase
MKWQHKARIQNLIASLPIADSAYYAVQRTAGGLRSSRLDPFAWLQASASIVAWITAAGGTVSGSHFLEVGTGRTVTVPLGLWLCGAGPIVSVDVNRYLSGTLTSECNRLVRSDPGRVREILESHADLPVFHERCRKLAAFRGDLPEFLRLINLQYLSPANATRLPFPEHTFDVHFSHAVLEHVPPPEVLGILQEAKRMLKPEGMLFHNIDPSDHFAHDDASISLINFLQFGDREWEKWAGNKYMYHNRLRAHELRELFDRAGVRVIRQNQTIDQRSLEALRSGFRVDAHFQNLPPEELAVTGMNLLGTFSRTFATGNSEGQMPAFGEARA